MPSPPLVTRFAPSPSGHLHVGGARTALFCWAYARGRDGSFILRIEDTDRKRTSSKASLGFFEDLKWLGIDWDQGPEFEGWGGGANGPYFQSERLPIYDRHLTELIEAGKAYRAFERPEELEADRAKARAEKRTYRYDRAALALDAQTVERYLAEGRPHVVRLRVPDEGEVVFRDEVLGEIRTSCAELDDFVIRKADGYPTYHFAVVVDDEAMGVTHVIRGQEHLKNTTKHVLIQDALGFARPVYAHVSTIANPDQSKMSKRDKDKTLRAVVQERGLDGPPPAGDGSMAVSADRWSWWLEAKDHQLELDEAQRLAEALDVKLPEINVDDFRRAGYLPEVLLNYLALLGWSPGSDVEKFDRHFLTERFDLDRIVKAPARFDRDKLLAFNLDAIQVMDPDEFVLRYREHCAAYHPEFVERLSPEAFAMLARANQPRSKTLDDTIASSRFFLIDDAAVEYEQTKAVRKALRGGPPSGLDHLEAILPQLEACETWDVASVERVLEDYASAHADGKLGKVAQPLRIAVSGGTISPAIYETLVILGNASVLGRVRRCLDLRDRVTATG
jgi:glutamyl-tRNA synthetase